MSSSNDGNDGDKNRPFRKVQTTNLLVNVDDNMSSLRDLLEVFLRIRIGVDQQEVVMISETQLETFGPFIREQLANLVIMTAHHPDENIPEDAAEGVEEEAETNPTATESEENEIPEPGEDGADEKKSGKDERVVKT